jgi:ribosomal protein L37AE/L43A
MPLFEKSGAKTFLIIHLAPLTASLLESGKWLIFWGVSVARNKVQFQKGLSEAGFQQQYGTEEKCRLAVISLRWPQGFRCPECGGSQHSVLANRGLFQCSQCRRQTSPIAGTIFASTKLPLTVWFRAMYHLTQSKQGISSIELGRRLGVTQSTAWKIKHKLAQVMMERNAAKKLAGRVEIDDAYVGGERRGGKRGRGAPGKTPFVAAAETTQDGKPTRLKLRRVSAFCAESVAKFANSSLEKECEVVSDGLNCFTAVTKAGCTHQIVRTGSGAVSGRSPTFKWVNTALGNIKAAITGTYRSISSKHVPRYLAEFEYRFNRRYDLAAMIPRLTRAATQAPPMPYKLLKLAEVHA